MFASYPLIPWIGVTAAGYVLGQIYSLELREAPWFLLKSGLGLTVAFIVLRTWQHLR